jgi:hypothetical protein
MSTLIVIKNSKVPGDSPTKLTPGELAINIADGNLYYGGANSDAHQLGLSSSFAVSASYATTASFALNSGDGGDPFPYTGSALITGSLGVIGPTEITTNFGDGVGGTALSVENNTYIDSGHTELVGVGIAGHGNIGIYGSTDVGTGVYGYSNDGGYGVRGLSNNGGVGVYANSDGTGVLATGDNYAIDAIGLVRITGDALIDGRLSNGLSADAVGLYSHAEGITFDGDGGVLPTEARGYGSHAEGAGTLALGTGSHAEGTSGNDGNGGNIQLVAFGNFSHAEGDRTTTSGSYSHAEGSLTITKGIGSHAEGHFASALGNYSHAEGYSTITSGSYQHVQGQFNLTSSAQSAFIVGNGTSNANRSNLIFASGSQVQITGSVIATQGFTGSLFGTASFAVSSSRAVSSSNALTASFITGSNVYGPYGSNSIISSSRAVSSSYALTASYALNGGGGGGVTGGATNYIALFSSPTSVTSSILYQTSSNVGIGTTTPQSKLDVNGDALINGLTIGRGGGNTSTNTALGYQALSSSAAGNNIAIGYQVGKNHTGEYSTLIGSNVTPDLANFNIGHALNIGKEGSPHFWAPPTLRVDPASSGRVLEIDSTTYSAAFIDYNLQDGVGAMRAGTLKVIWKIDGTYKLTEEATDSIGDTIKYYFTTNIGGGIFKIVLFNDDASTLVRINCTCRLLIRPV